MLQNTIQMLVLNGLRNNGNNKAFIRNMWRATFKHYYTIIFYAFY